MIKPRRQIRLVQIQNPNSMNASMSTLLIVHLQIPDQLFSERITKQLLLEVHKKHLYKRRKIGSAGTLDCFINSLPSVLFLNKAIKMKGGASSLPLHESGGNTLPQQITPRGHLYTMSEK